MLKRLKHMLFCGALLVILVCAFGSVANAFEYDGSVNDVNLSTYTINIGGTTLPLAEFPDGSHTTFDGSTYNHYMTIAQAAKHGITLSKDLYLASAECMAFARYVYAALYYKYPATASMDNYIASEINPYGSYAYIDVISSPWEGGTYSASDFERLVKSCYPGSFIRQGGHSMVIMSIFDDGLIVYDGNFSTTDYNVVDVRKYTWESYVSTFGGRTIFALQTPSYYPGYSDSLGRTGGGAYDYDLDTSQAGTYKVTASGSLNVRSGPSTAYSRVGSLDGGTNVDVLGIYNGWAAIEYNGAACWLSMDYLKLVSLAPRVDGYLIDTTYAGQYEVCNSSYVNVRALPTTNSAAVGKLYKDVDVVDVRGTYNGWAAITYNSDDCWVSMDYLTSYVEKLTVTFDANGGTASEDSGTYESGLEFGALPTATKTDRTFIGWYSGTTHYTESSIVPSGNALTLKAKWGLYSFLDVEDVRWYCPAIQFAYDNNVMQGVSATSFMPNSNLNRAMMVQILYNLAGQPEVTTTTPTFTDVGTGRWYFKAVEWAAANGLTNGRGNGLFDPSDDISRQDMVTMIWRYATNYLGMDTSNRSDLSGFTDGNTVAKYALEPMQWAVAEGLVNGMNDGTLAPSNTATRAQVAKIMMEFLSE